VPVDPWAIDSLAFSGLEARNVEALSVMTDGTALGSRSGTRPGDPGLTVTLAGTTINCSAGAAVVAWPGQGVYKVAFPSSVSPGTYTAAHATLNRVDLVYVRVWDNSVDASGLNKADIVYLAGTPSASPVAPTPAGTQIYMPIATISVLSVSNGGTASVSTAVRPSTVAPGGILPSSVAPSSPYTGQAYYTGTDLLVWNGTAWDTYVKTPGAWTSYPPTWTGSGSNPSLGNGTLVGRYSKVGRLVTVHINLIPGSTTTYGSGNYNWALPFAAANNGCSYILSAHLLGTDRWMGQMVISPAATTTSAFFNLSTTNSRIDFMTPTRPETFANGSQLRITGTYESAT